MAAAAVSTIASRALILEAPSEYIFSEAPVALDSPPEPLDGPGVNASGETMPNMLPAAFQPPEFPALERAEPDNLMALVQALATPPWEATVEAGDTLDVLLSLADMDAQTRTEVALALTVEYDLRRLRPGHRLSVDFRPDGERRKSKAIHDSRAISVIYEIHLSCESPFAIDQTRRIPRSKPVVDVHDRHT